MLAASMFLQNPMLPPISHLSLSSPPRRNLCLQVLPLRQRNTQPLLTTSRCLQRSRSRSRRRVTREERSPEPRTRRHELLDSQPQARMLFFEHLARCIFVVFDIHNQFQTCFSFPQLFQIQCDCLEYSISTCSDTPYFRLPEPFH